MAAWAKKVLAFPEDKILIAATRPLSVQPTIDPRAAVTHRLLEKTGGTAINKFQTVHTVGYEARRADMDHATWVHSPISARLGLPLMGTLAPWRTDGVRNVAMMTLFGHDDVADLASFGKTYPAVRGWGEIWFARQDYKHLHQVQLMALLQFCQWGPLKKFCLRKNEVPDGYTHSKEDAEEIISKATPEAFEAFFHEMRETELKSNDASPDWKEVDSPF